MATIKLKPAMRSVALIFCFCLLPFVGRGQDTNAERNDKDSTYFQTSNSFVINERNYETINNSFITGNSYAMIRSQNNPKLLLDGIPINPILFNRLHYTEFLGSMHLFSYELQSAGISYLQHDNKIISGQYNNAISFKTRDIDLGSLSPQFEINSFSVLSYQDIDNPGVSSILNFNVQQGFEKFGYRISLHNGFHNDHIPENGLQRFGGNLKLKYKPHEIVSLTGFLDYTDFQDFRRNEDNNQKSGRLLTFVNADASLTEWLSLSGKFGLNQLSDISERVLIREVAYSDDYQFIETYTRKNNFKYNSAYADFGLSLHREFERNRFINFKLGYNQNITNYFDEFEYNFQSTLEEGYSLMTHGKREPEAREKAWYASFHFGNKNLNVKYLVNRMDYGFEGMPFNKKESNVFHNHLLSVRYDAIRSDNPILNDLGLQIDLGRLTNYSIIPQPVVLNPFPGYQQPEWTTRFDNDNLQIFLFSSFFKNRLELDFSFYHKNYKSFYHLFRYEILWTGRWVETLENIGEISKSGYEFYGRYHIVQNHALNWLVVSAYNINSSKFTRDDNLIFQLPDTIVHNRMISISNHFAYRGIRLFFEIEGKNGFDINLYRNNISVAEPFSYGRSKQVTGVNHEGIPVSEFLFHKPDYITDTDYFILRQIGLEYHIRDNTRGNDYFIGLQYNRLRRIYLFVDDIATYREQFQRPSFYNSLSVSFKMKF